MDPSKATHLRRSSRKKVLTTSFHSRRPRTVPFKGGNASTHSTETIGHSQARASLGKTRTGIIAASIGDRTKEAQVWAWLRDADRPWEGFSLPNDLSKISEVFPYNTKRERVQSSQRERDQNDLGNKARLVASGCSLFSEQGEGPQPKKALCRTSGKFTARFVRQHSDMLPPVKWS